MSESREMRLKRMKLRARRRGTKEMDLVLGGFALARLEEMDEDALDLFESLLEEGDNDLWDWITARRPCPRRWEGLVGRIRAHAGLAEAPGFGKID